MLRNHSVPHFVNPFYALVSINVSAFQYSTANAMKFWEYLHETVENDNIQQRTAQPAFTCSKSPIETPEKCLYC